MSLEKIISDLKEIGEEEAAMKILLMASGLTQRPESFGPEGTVISDLFIWRQAPEGHEYWDDIDNKLNHYRNRRSQNEHYPTL